MFSSTWSIGDHPRPEDEDIVVRNRLAATLTRTAGNGSAQDTRKLSGRLWLDKLNSGP